MKQVAVIHTAFEDRPVTVAFVKVPDEFSADMALEYAFQKTNNIEGSWSKPAVFEFDGKVVDNPDYCEDVIVTKPLYIDEDGKEWGHRSTSVGDQMLFGTTKYVVGMAGFEELV